MAENRDDPEVHWIDPSRRGVLPLEGFHISRSLARTMQSDRFETRFDTDFTGVVQGCADREETWINDTIFDLYRDLNRMGHAHCQEIWEGDELIGGVYGVSLGCAFFGESMFSRRTNASKVALAYLVDRLRQTGFSLFDTQFLTAHLKTLGGVEVERNDYLRALEKAVSGKADIMALTTPQTAQGVIQRNTQTS
ncbi:MAG: leucyl/phenylalanyl-tRNA--protein transferase [Marinosulfonomonas sp.]|nr:leucyl/phenylalanyl-tRNA--protein transferase [Marinosulfonomonas sp.]